MDERQLGKLTQYEVRRLNDSIGKHNNCEYWVLDLVHDKFSKPALLAYIAACEAEYPVLAAELRTMATDE